MTLKRVINSEKIATVTKNMISPIRKFGGIENKISMFRKNTNLHKTLGPILALAQCFGLMPVQGILAKSEQQLHFLSYSIKALYTYGVLCSAAIMASLSIIHMVRSFNSDTFSVLGGLNAATAGAVFYGNAFLATLLFFKLSKHWSHIMKRWNEVEFFLNYGSGYLFGELRNFSRVPAYLLTATILLLAFAEHSLSVAINLKSEENNLEMDWLKKYTLASHQFIFNSIDYTTIRATFVFILSKIATFTWNFMDLFLMLMCQALTQLFQQFNTNVLAKEGKVLRQTTWREIREQYVALASLTRLLDHNIAALTLLSFSNNLYFICMQLLHGLTPPPDVTTLWLVYFWGSFIFLVGRTGAVIFHASNIHHVSRGALPAVFSCPSVAYCEETARLQQHMCGEELAITGLGLFHVTRNFMLAVAGAIATYEVVLLQFNVAMATSCAVVPSTASSSLVASKT